MRAASTAPVSPERLEGPGTGAHQVLVRLSDEDTSDTVKSVAYMESARRASSRSRALRAAQVILVFVAFLYVVELADTILANRLDGAGVLPRDVGGLDGILFAPILHAGWGHLVANTVPLLIFGFLILLGGVARWVAVTAVVWLLGGLGVWLTGGDHSLHLGASVLAFGWLVYLLVRGFFSGSGVQILVGAVLLFLYGGLLWGVLPGQSGVSWQGHFFGALGGFVAAWWLGGRDRARAQGVLDRKVY